MKLVTYEGNDATPRAGVLVGDGIIDLAEMSDGELSTDLATLFAMPGWRERLGAVDLTNGNRISAESVRLLAPIPRPGKLLAAAGNYQDHVAEGGGERVDTSRRTPRVFIKPASTVIAADAPLVLPTVSNEVDWEAELGVVIGARGRDVGVDEALDLVAGYLVINDVSARSMNWGVPDREVHDWDRFFDWLTGKWIDGFAPVGPFIATRDEITDPQALRIRLTVNGTTWQDGSTAEMIFSCAELIAFCSRICTLEPGDIIATGTPAGTGVAAGVFLNAGDRMVTSIDGLGEITTDVVAAAP